MKYLILDDEPLSHDIIESYAEKLPFLVKSGNCYDAIEAMEFLTENQVDLIFLDIRMPKLKGYDFLRTLKMKPLVIAVTAHAEYALEGYDLDLCDYLLKPFGFERFLRAVNKARERYSGELSQPVEDPVWEKHESLFIKDGKKHHQVRFRDIELIEASGNYCYVETDQGKIMTQETLADLEQRLPASFVRVHRSFIVATQRITWVEGDELGIGKKRIPIGRVYKPNVLKLLR